MFWLRTEKKIQLHTLIWEPVVVSHFFLQEYSLKIQRGLSADLCWQLKKRYSDFVQLDAELNVSGVVLPLPPKKLIGNFDREFVAERQLGLQV